MVGGGRDDTRRPTTWGCPEKGHNVKVTYGVEKGK